MSDLDTAAAAFEQAMNPAPAKSSPKEEPEVVDNFFRNGELDDDSDSRGGGDEEIEPELDENGDPIEADPDDEEAGGDEEDDEKEEGDEPDELLANEVEVVIDGKPATVTVKEAVEGYIRMETFHQRMNTLDEVKKIVAKEAETVINDRKRYSEMITELDTVLKQYSAEPDWDALFKEDPAKARQLQKQYDTFKTQREALAAEKQRVDKEAEESAMKETREYGETEFKKFLQANPKITTQGDLQKELQSMHRTAASTGFSQEEINEVLDSRMLIILQKASKYDRMMAARPKPVNRQGNDTKRPGAGKATAPKGLVTAQKRLSKTGSIDDAASVFAKMIK